MRSLNILVMTGIKQLLQSETGFGYRKVLSSMVPYLNCVKRKGEGEKQIFAVSIGTYQKVRFSNLRCSSKAAVCKGLRSVERLDP